MSFDVRFLQVHCREASGREATSVDLAVAIRAHANALVDLLDETLEALAVNKISDLSVFIIIDVMKIQTAWIAFVTQSAASFFLDGVHQTIELTTFASGVCHHFWAKDISIICIMFLRTSDGTLFAK